jgi:hypothetical protein
LVPAQTENPNGGITGGGLTVTVTGQLFRTKSGTIPKPGTRTDAKKVVVVVRLCTPWEIGFIMVPNSPCVPNVMIPPTGTPPTDRVTGSPRQIADCEADSVNKDAGLTETETVDVETQPNSFLAVTVNVLTPVVRVDVVALVVVAPVNVTPAGALTVMLLPALTCVLSVTACPTQTALLLAVSVTDGGATTDTDTVAVVKQIGLLLTVTVNVLSPVGKPVAVAVAVVAPVNVTPAGPLTAYV